jgi:hypothetical protein
VLSASIARIAKMMMMVAASTSETSVNFYQNTGCNNPQEIHLN